MMWSGVAPNYHFNDVLDWFFVFLPFEKAFMIEFRLQTKGLGIWRKRLLDSRERERGESPEVITSDFFFKKKKHHKIILFIYQITRR